jgi:hypothetical protein
MDIDGLATLARGERAERPRSGAESVARALAAVNVEDTACHEAGRFQVEDRLDDVRDLAQMAN